MHCRQCGNKLADQAKFCPRCGTPVTAQIPGVCVNCGHALKEGAKFCPGCGSEVTAGAPAGPAGNAKTNAGTKDDKTNIPNKPLLTWKTFLGMVLKQTGKNLAKSIPMMIVVFLITMLLHTYLLVVRNEGFGAGTWLGRELLATQGRVVSATLFWMILSGFIFSALPQIRKKGLGVWMSDIVHIPEMMRDYVREAGKDGLVLLLSGMGISLVISGIMSNMTSLVLAVGLAAVFASPLGRVLAILIQSTWVTLVTTINPKQAEATAQFGVVPAYVGLIGTSLGFALAFILPWSSWLGIIMLGGAAYLLYSGGSQGGNRSTGLLFFLFTLTVVLLKAKGVLADDGGWAECGGTFSSWVHSPGSVRAVLHGVGPSAGAAVGPALTNALTSIGPADFSVPNQNGPQGTDEGDGPNSSDTGGYGQDASNAGEGDDARKYDEDGYDEDGYDRNGYDRDGYDRNGYDRNGYDRNGYDHNGYDAEGYDQNGKDRDGFYRNGYNDEGYDRNGRDVEGYDRNGFDENGFDREGFDRDGFNANGLDREGFDRNGFNAEGFDREGFNREGFDREGFDRDGFNNNGYDRDGYNRNGYDADGFDRNGIGQDGYDRDGYDRNGYDRDGYDRNGYDKNGFDSEGYDKDGFNRKGFDKDGYDRDGFNATGYDREGYDRDGYDRRGFNRDGINRQGKTFDEVLEELKAKQEKLEQDAASANSSAWWWDKAHSATEWVQWGADKSIDVLSNVTGPAGGRIKDIYTVAKGTAEGLGEAIADGKDYTSHIAKGTLKGVTDLGLGKIMDAGAGKITDMTGGKLPGFKEYTPFNSGDAAWGEARTGFIKDALMGKDTVHDSVSDMVRDKFATAGKNVIQGTIRDKLSKDPIMDAMFGKGDK